MIVSLLGLLMLVLLFLSVNKASRNKKVASRDNFVSLDRIGKKKKMRLVLFLPIKNSTKPSKSKAIDGSRQGTSGIEIASQDDCVDSFSFEAMHLRKH